MKTKHSQGPWKVDQTTLFRGEEMVTDELGQRIASIKDMGEGVFNAKLIAAVPELLHELRCMRTMVQHLTNCGAFTGDNNHHLNHISERMAESQKAIKKATE